MDRQAEPIGFFSKYQNKIYANVPSNGDYPMPEADAASFHLLADHYAAQH